MRIESALEEFAVRVADHVASQMSVECEPSPSKAEEWRLLTASEVGLRLGRSPRWVRARVQDGSLPHVRLDGGPLAFDLADVREFALERRIDVRDTEPGANTRSHRNILGVQPGWDS